MSASLALNNKLYSLSFFVLIKDKEGIIRYRQTGKNKKSPQGENSSENILSEFSDS